MSCGLTGQLTGTCKHDTDLGGFSFSCAGWAGRSTTKLEMEGTSKCQVASIGKRCDDQPTSVTQVLIAIQKLGIDSPDVQFPLHPVVPAVFIAQDETQSLLCKSKCIADYHHIYTKLLSIES